MKSGQIKSLEEPFLSLQKAVSEEETTKSGYKRLPQSERVQRAIEAACTQAEDKFGEKTPAWILWIRPRTPHRWFLVSLAPDRFGLL